MPKRSLPGSWALGAGSGADAFMEPGDDVVHHLFDIGGFFGAEFGFEVVAGFGEVQEAAVSGADGFEDRCGVGVGVVFGVGEGVGSVAGPGAAGVRGGQRTERKQATAWGSRWGSCSRANCVGGVRYSRGGSLLSANGLL